MTYDQMINRILAHEGELTMNPLDRGNWTSGKVGRGSLKGTKLGISAMSYPDVDIKNLTFETAKRLYYRDFYAPLKPSILKPATVFQLLDFAVNSGVRSATKSLQKAVGVKADGIIGPKTCHAASCASDSDIVFLILADRLELMASLSVWTSFGRGWAKRIATNLRYAAQDIK